MENINKETMERLAEAAHKVWMEGATYALRSLHFLFAQ